MRELSGCTFIRTNFYSRYLYLVTLCENSVLSRTYGNYNAHLYQLNEKMYSPINLCQWEYTCVNGYIWFTFNLFYFQDYIGQKWMRTSHLEFCGKMRSFF